MSSTKFVLGCDLYVPQGNVFPHNKDTGSFVYILPSGDIRAYINYNLDDRTGEVKYCVVFPDSKPEGIPATILKKFNLVTLLPSGKNGEKTLFKLSLSMAGVNPVGTIGDHFRSLTSSPYIGFAIDTKNGFTIQEKTIALVMKNRKLQKLTVVQEFFQILFDGIYPGSMSIPEVKVESSPKVVELQVSSTSFPALPGQKIVIPEIATPVIETIVPVPVLETATPVLETIVPVPVLATIVPVPVLETIVPVPVLETIVPVPVLATIVPVPVLETAIPVLPITESNSLLSEEDIYSCKYRLLELEMFKLSAEHYLKKLKASMNDNFTEDERDSYEEQILGFERDLITFKREQRLITNTLTGTI